MKWLTTVWANCSPGTTKFKNIPELFCSFDIQWGFVSLYCNFYTHSSLLCKCISTMSSHSGQPLTHNCAFIPELAWYIFINKAIIRKNLSHLCNLTWEFILQSLCQIARHNLLSILNVWTKMWKKAFMFSDPKNTIVCKRNLIYLANFKTKFYGVVQDSFINWCDVFHTPYVLLLQKIFIILFCNLTTSIVSSIPIIHKFHTFWNIQHFRNED